VSGRRKVKSKIELAVRAMEFAERIDQIVLFSGDGDFLLRQKPGETFISGPSGRIATRVALVCLAYDMESLLSPILAAALLTIITFNGLLIGKRVGHPT